MSTKARFTTCGLFMAQIYDAEFCYCFVADINFFTENVMNYNLSPESALYDLISNKK
jgi:hypothetical protein